MFGVFYSDDLGAHWKAMDAGLPEQSTVGVQGLYADGQTVLVQDKGRLYRTDAPWACGLSTTSPAPNRMAAGAYLSRAPPTDGAAPRTEWIRVIEELRPVKRGPRHQIAELYGREFSSKHPREDRMLQWYQSFRVGCPSGLAIVPRRRPR